MRGAQMMEPKERYELNGKDEYKTNIWIPVQRRQQKGATRGQIPTLLMCRNVNFARDFISRQIDNPPVTITFVYLYNMETRKSTHFQGEICRRWIK